MMKKLFALTTLCAAALGFGGCQSMDSQMQTGNLMSQPVFKSTIYTTTPEPVAIGTVYFRPVDAGVQVYGQVSGLAPNDTLGIHIHETGSCKNGGMDAGGHFNPTNKPHGEPDTVMSHAGDLPNITTNPYGVADINYVADKITADMIGPRSIYRRAIIIDANADDYASQPAGHSGARIACGIIEKN